MEKLNQANISLSQPTDIRVIYLPPAAIAAAHYVGDEPENHVNTLLDGFVRENKLHKIKPDLRRYGSTILTRLTKQAIMAMKRG